MTVSKVFSLIAVVILMSCGQILFKLAAQRLGPLDLSWNMLTRLAFNPYLIAAIILYGFTTILWVLVLTDVELSKSYPFMALAMILVPIGGAVLFNEAITFGLIVGGGLIVLGLLAISFL